MQYPLQAFLSVIPVLPLYVDIKQFLIDLATFMPEYSVPVNPAQHFFPYNHTGSCNLSQCSCTTDAQNFNSLLIGSPTIYLSSKRKPDPLKAVYLISSCGLITTALFLTYQKTLHTYSVPLASAGKNYTLKLVFDTKVIPDVYLNYFINSLN